MNKFRFMIIIAKCKYVCKKDTSFIQYFIFSILHASHNYFTLGRYIKIFMYLEHIDILSKFSRGKKTTWHIYKNTIFFLQLSFKNSNNTCIIKIKCR